MKHKYLPLLLGIALSLQLKAQTTKPNFLFIVIDDLNNYTTDLGGQPQTFTPNISALDSLGVSFTTAYANAPGCAPSRTSFLSGKDVNYCKVYNNADYEGKFRKHFQDSLGNGTVFTIPEILKDSGGYYTFGIYKIFHATQDNDFDKSHADGMCEKKQSWNRMSNFDEDEWFTELTESTYEFLHQFYWGKIPDSLEPELLDYHIADTAIQYINDYASGDPFASCAGKPFFLGVGFHLPHENRFIPAQYYMPYYLDDIYEDPFVIPYNQPYNQFPYNGIVPAAQPPQGMYADYDSLPAGGLAQDFADNGHVYADVVDYTNSLATLPVIDPGLTDEERKQIIEQSILANYELTYSAAVKFVDLQVGKVVNALKSHPDLYNNTIIVLIGDQGYSLGSKKHWTKWALWETDLRVPMVIVRPGKPGNLVCNHVVSLLDLFPTIMDLAGIPYPTFPDGSSYPDGHSLLPLLDDPGRAWTHPSLASYKPNAAAGNCFGQYSVRDDRFQYIRYTPNNDGTLPLNICDPDADTVQLELYDIGVNHETDPHEWHNLAYDPDYAPEINYLNNFIPGGNLYLKNPLAVVIQNGNLPCLLSNSTLLKLRAKLYDDNGNPITGTDLLNYYFTWSNNLTPEVHHAPVWAFDLSTISPAVFATSDRVQIYLSITDVTTGQQVGFSMKTVYINPGNTPVADYSVNLDDSIATISGYTLTGSYTSTYWNFGDGSTMLNDYVPAPHAYDASGLFKIRNIVYYGNQPTCRKVFAKNISVAGPPAMRETDPGFSVYPNPACDYVMISGEDIAGLASVQIFNTMGQCVRVFKVDDPGPSCRIDTKGLPSGSYLLRFTGNGFTSEKELEIMR